MDAILCKDLFKRQNYGQTTDYSDPDLRRDKYWLFRALGLGTEKEAHHSNYDQYVDGTVDAFADSVGRDARCINSGVQGFDTRRRGCVSHY